MDSLSFEDLMFMHLNSCGPCESNSRLKRDDVLSYESCLYDQCSNPLTCVIGLYCLYLSRSTAGNFDLYIIVLKDRITIWLTTVSNLRALSLLYLKNCVTWWNRLIDDNFILCIARSSNCSIESNI